MKHSEVRKKMKDAIALAYEAGEPYNVPMFEILFAKLLNDGETIDWSISENSAELLNDGEHGISERVAELLNKQDPTKEWTAKDVDLLCSGKPPES